MPKIEIRQAHQSDLEKILLLQEKYHISNLTEQEKQEKGFVTMKVTPQQFTELIERRGVFIAVDEDVVAAYALTSDWFFYRQWAIIQTMEALLPSLTFEEQTITVENSFQYGPVCIDEAYRGKNILNALFKDIEQFYVRKYKYSITFINQKNERSIRAHAKQTPLSIIGNFAFNDNQYHALASKLK